MRLAASARPAGCPAAERPPQALVPPAVDHPGDEFLPSPAAVVACRQLGFPIERPDWNKFAGVGARWPPEPYTVDVATPQAVARVACTGSERSLSECALTFTPPDSPCAGPRPDPQQCAYLHLTCSSQ